MPARYVLKNAAGAQRFMFNLKAGNNETILTSETYSSKAGALAGIQSVRTNSPHDARYTRKTGLAGTRFFVLHAVNGEPIGTSEHYGSAAAMESGIASVNANGPGAPVDDQTS